MRTVVLLCAALTSLYLAYEAIRFFSLVAVSKSVVTRATKYERAGLGPSLLVLGDSTGVGVGASQAEDSVAGRLALSRGYSRVENYAESGADADDLSIQYERATLPEYDLALVQIGANDVIRFHDPEEVAKKIEPTLALLKNRAQKVVWISAGDIGVAPIFPWPLSWWYKKSTPHFHAAFKKTASGVGVTYVSLYTPPEIDPFVLEPNTYFAEDIIHPSSEGYRIWFERIVKKL